MAKRDHQKQTHTAVDAACRLLHALARTNDHDQRRRLVVDALVNFANARVSEATAAPTRRELATAAAAGAGAAVATRALDGLLRLSAPRQTADQPPKGRG